MLVESIRSGEFNRLLPSHLALEKLMDGQVEWFSDKKKNIIGAIAKGNGRAGWNYAILRRRKPGRFRVCDVRANFASYKIARVDFLLALAGDGPERAQRVHQVGGR